MNLYIDLGGTYLRYQIDSSSVQRTQSDDAITFIGELLVKYPAIKKIFISFAGQVKNGVILSSPNLFIENFDIKAHFFPKEVFIENDLNCAVLAQSRYFHEPDIVALYIGTGIGSGIVLDGTLVRGARNLAGEIGHVAFKKAPFVCGCSKDNCIELFSSGSGIKKWGKYYQQEFETLQDLPKELYNDFLGGMMQAVSTLVTLFNPRVVVLGGGVVENNPFLLEYIEKNIAKYAFPPALKDLKIVISEISDAPLQGCKLLEET